MWQFASAAVSCASLVPGNISCGAGTTPWWWAEGQRLLHSDQTWVQERLQEKMAALWTSSEAQVPTENLLGKKIRICGLESCGLES